MVKKPDLYKIPRSHNSFTKISSSTRKYSPRHSISRSSCTKRMLHRRRLRRKAKHILRARAFDAYYRGSVVSRTSDVFIYDDEEEEEEEKKDDARPDHCRRGNDRRRAAIVPEVVHGRTQRYRARGVNFDLMILRGELTAL